MENKKADVVVVAAGLSGLAASIAAAEEGKSVITVEKSNVTGGAANMGMSPLAIGTHYQRSANFNMTPGEAWRKHMNFIHWQGDARLIKKYYEKTASTIEWLEDMGVEFCGLITAYAVGENERAYATAYPTAHCVKPEGGGEPGPRCAGAMTKKMTERAQELGVEILFETVGESIIMEDGRAVGIKATDKDGEFEIRANAVIIATGGFGDNPELIKERFGYEWGKDLFSFRIPGMRGDGIRMAWEVGAGHSKMMMELMYQCPDNMTVFSLDGAFRQPVLWVNKRGERFMNEDMAPNSTFTGNAIINQPANVGFSIMDQRIINVYKKKGPDLLDHVHGDKIFENFDADVDLALSSGYKYLHKADTLEELAEQMGVPVDAFVEAVEEYNDMCDAGWDDLFEKDRRYLYPVRKGPFYALEFYAGAYGTLGDIKVNHKLEVETDDFQTIPGLYAVGTDACAIYGDCYPFTFAGNTMGFCLNSGRMAGENASEYIDEL